MTSVVATTCHHYGALSREIAVDILGLEHTAQPGSHEISLSIHLEAKPLVRRRTHIIAPYRKTTI